MIYTSLIVYTNMGQRILIVEDLYFEVKFEIRLEIHTLELKSKFLICTRHPQVSYLNTKALKRIFLLNNCLILEINVKISFKIYILKMKFILEINFIINFETDILNAPSAVLRITALQSPTSHIHKNFLTSVPHRQESLPMRA